jgi:putative ABC transport system permease protein
VALISGTLIVYDQLNFMMNRSIGMNIEQVLVIERPGIAPRDRQAFYSNVDVFRNELERDATIQGVSTSATIPGKQREYKAVIKKYGANDDTAITVRFNSMDYDFIDVFDMKLLAGRGFSKDFTNDPDTSMIITESAVKLLGFGKPEDAIGQTLAVPQFQWNGIVVGVVNDYHQVSLKKALDPTVFYCTAYGGEFYSLKINTTDLPGTLASIRSAWTTAFPGNPFEYFFLDDYFNMQYENEKKFGKLFTTFSLLAIIVGCIGLFGLSAFTATQRTKEIGIRKALGSTVNGIFLLLSREYLKLVGFSVLIAVPLVYLVMRDWIQSFPYRISISIFVFVIAGIAVLLISLLTISFQTLRAAKTNPVDSLRYE